MKLIYKAFVRNQKEKEFLLSNTKESKAIKRHSYCIKVYANKIRQEALKSGLRRLSERE